LLPRLEREDRDFVTLPLIRPGTAALSGRAGLAVALEQAFEKFHRSPGMALGHLQLALAGDSDALPQLLNELLVLATNRLIGGAKPQNERPPTLVLAIDQAEELFTPDGGHEAAKLRQHLAAALTRGPDTIALLTIRSDRFSILQNDELFAKLLEPFNLPPMPATVYRDAILRPAARLTPPLAIEAKLTEALIEDTAAEGADPLPLLAFTLERLYRGYGKGKEGLTLKHYEDLGGIAGSINAAIDEAFSKPRNEPPIPADRHERERLLEAAFVPALVDINQTNGEPVSRIGKESEIPAECRNSIQRLVNARLLVSDEAPARDDGNAVTTYRVAHEALLRRWDWLRSLLDHQAGLLNAAQVLERQAQAWERSRRSKDWLDLRGDRLHEAVLLAARDGFKERLRGPPAAYIVACQKMERAAAWRRRRSYSIVAASMLVISGLAYGAWINQSPLKIHLGHFADVWMPRMLAPEAESALRPRDSFKECTNCPDMVVIPAGSFVMGSGTGESHEKPMHRITIVMPFAVSKFEVTFDQWDACVALGGCSHRPGDAGWGRGRRPVINVSWDDVQPYVKWLAATTGRPYKLLSEAEWEYVARSGSDAAYSWGDEAGKGNANCADCGSTWGKIETAPVGSFPANAFGVYDMHGNVWEWVQDCYHPSYDASPKDGSSWEAACTEDHRVGRGGSWRDDRQRLRAANRSRDTTSARNDDLGFRVARMLRP
jgi:formylglycine-generating enzyme required for sulfatase activity